jgi:hypothetical protein
MKFKEKSIIEFNVFVELFNNHSVFSIGGFVMTKNIIHTGHVKSRWHTI